MLNNLFGKKNNWILILAIVAAVVYFVPGLFSTLTGGAVQVQPTVGPAATEQFCGDGCGELGYPYGCGQKDAQDAPVENFSSCYQRKQVYLNSCNPDEPTGHADVNLEKRFGKLYININANLPYAKGGVMHTAWGAYHAFLSNSHKNKSINLGSLVRHGDRFYKLSTELLGDYGEYDEILVYQTVEDYQPKLVLRGSISGQQCSSL